MVEMTFREGPASKANLSLKGGVSQQVRALTCFQQLLVDLKIKVRVMLPEHGVNAQRTHFIGQSD